MYVWHRETEFVPPDGFVAVTVRLDETPRSFERLIEDAVYARLEALGFQRKGEGWVNYGKKSLLAEVPAPASTVRESIGIYPKIIAEVFFTKTANDALLIGLVVDVLYTTRMDVTAAEWVNAGLGDQLHGLYVALVGATEEAIRFPNHVGRTIGRIEGLRGGPLRLDPDLRTPVLSAVPLISPLPSRLVQISVSTSRRATRRRTPLASQD